MDLLESTGIVERIGASVIGDDATFDGPYGRRRIVYADYVASGRALTFVEDFVREHVLPYYGNTHSESSATAFQVTRLCEDARDIIHDACGADDDTVVLFAGAGATGAVDKLVGILNLKVSRDLDDRYHLTDAIPPDERPVVFIGPYEHHSNDLPWRESIAETVEIPDDMQGHIDLERLEAELIHYRDRPLRIGSFSAASNVTGILTDTDAVSALLHAHGALSFWDCSAAAPYAPIAMGGPADGPAYKDVIFFSPHKFVGGPGASGVLLIRRELLRNQVPATPGGGTVAFVSSTRRIYRPDLIAREEGGTPNILGEIRAGLAFQVKEAVGTDVIRASEERFWKRALTAWGANPNIVILGEQTVPRLSIISILVRHGERFLHHNFVVALLNDVFGIQARGGCSCAGPYGHRLLGLTDAQSQEIERQVACGYQAYKPGWSRISFNFFLSEPVVDFIIEAVNMVADDGWRLLPDYEFDLETSLWRHRTAPDPAVRLTDLTFDAEHGLVCPHVNVPPGHADLAGYLADARRLFAERTDTSWHDDELAWLSGYGDTGAPFALPTCCVDRPTVF